MATLRRPKEKRIDQPDMFCPPVEATDGVRFAGTNTKARSTKADNRHGVRRDGSYQPKLAQQDDDQNEQPEHYQAPSARPQVFIKRYPASVLTLGRIGTAGDAVTNANADDADADDTIEPTPTQRHIYVSRSLLFVVVIAHAMEVLPDELPVCFRGEESPADARLCSLLTIELEWMILEKLAAMEIAYERRDGAVAEVDYLTMRHRWRELQQAWQALPVRVHGFGVEVGS